MSVAPRVNLVTLGVADVGTSRAFYRGLGWAESSVGNKDVAFFQLGGLVLSLFAHDQLTADAKLAEPGRAGAVTLAQNVADKAEVDRVLEAAAAAGAVILKPAQDVFWGGYAGYFADPDGHPWEIAWNPSWEFGEDGSVRLPA
jgi:catechol 2,3-dioxygenase-like lactoylglutathione lyase family enzyme